ncbi:MAG: hypothetical protein H0X33_11280 [Taibaiella sp.]|nr:hypothetical protein [Taibaiella sp.]
MRKTTLSLLTILLPLLSNAQSARIDFDNKHYTKKEHVTDNKIKIFIRSGIGQAFPQAGQTYSGGGFFSGSETTQSNGQYSYDIKKASFSSGIQGFIGFGGMFNKHVGVELIANIGLSNTSYTATYYHDTVNAIPSTTTNTRKAKTPVFLIPSLIIQTGGENINLYTKVGIVLPVRSQLEEVHEYTNEPGTGAIRTLGYTYTKTFNFTVGYAAAIGISKELPRLEVYTEVNMLSLGLVPKQEVLTSASYNGATGNSKGSYASQISAQYQTTSTYSYTLNTNSNGTSRYAYSLPFSNVGICIGVKFNLDK